jgi:hypothetical protein
MSQTVPSGRTLVHPPQREVKRNTTQTISLMVGSLLFVLGLSGLLSPSFMGLHLSVLHSCIITAAGVTLFYNGYRRHRRAAFNTCLGFGLFFAALSLIGFVFGQPGQPAVGFERPDRYLLKIIPGFQELGFLDHLVHAVIAVVLLGGAYDWYRGHKGKRPLLEV